MSVGVRMFVALVPPDHVVEDLEEFLAPRQEAGPELRWTGPEQWHLTLAFLPQVADRHLDELEERLARAAGRRTLLDLTLAGAGAFPDPSRAKVVFAAVEAAGPLVGDELDRLATGARAAAVKAGIVVDGSRFHPHVTLARTGRPMQVTRWLRVLSAYRGPAWRATEVSLVESHLGEGARRRPRYQIRATFPLDRAEDTA